MSTPQPTSDAGSEHHAYFPTPPAQPPPSTRVLVPHPPPGPPPPEASRLSLPRNGCTVSSQVLQSLQGDLVAKGRFTPSPPTSPPPQRPHSLPMPHHIVSSTPSTSMNSAEEIRADTASPLRPVEDVPLPSEIPPVPSCPLPELPQPLPVPPTILPPLPPPPRSSSVSSFSSSSSSSSAAVVPPPPPPPPRLPSTTTTTTTSSSSSFVHVHPHRARQSRISLPPAPPPARPSGHSRQPSLPSLASAAAAAAKARMEAREKAVVSEGHLEIKRAVPVVPKLLIPPWNPKELLERMHTVEGGVSRIQALIRGFLARQHARKRRKQLHRREEATREILETERTYCYFLDVLVKVFLDSLRKESQKAKPCITLEQVHAIFCNIELIYNFNKTLLSDLESVVQGTSTASLGKIFSRMCPFLKLYTEYLNHFEQSATTLNACNANPAFLRLLKELYKNPMAIDLGTRDLSSLLIMPVQRIPRYELLLKVLVDNTDPSHADRFDLSRALDKIRQVAIHINESKRKAETLTRLVSLQSTITNLPMALVEPHRVFVREGPLRLLNVPKRDRELHFFLFNDMLIYARSKRTTRGMSFDCRGTIPLGLSTIIDQNPQDVEGNEICMGLCSPSANDPHVSSEEGTNRDLIIAFASWEERDSWLASIQDVIGELRESLESRSRLLGQLQTQQSSALDSELQLSARAAPRLLESLAESEEPTADNPFEAIQRIAQEYPVETGIRQIQLLWRARRLRTLLKTRALKRDTVTSEFLKKAHDYVLHLNALVQGFKKPLEFKLNEPRPIITTDAIADIFQNVELIYMFSQEISTRYTSSVSQYRAHNQGIGRPGNAIASVFLEHRDEFKHLYCDFLKRRECQTAALRKAQGSQGFVKLIDNCRKSPLVHACGNMDLASFLRLPLEHLTEYDEFFEFLLEKTESEKSPKAPSIVRCALGVVRDVITTRRRFEVLARISNPPKLLLEENVAFLREGILTLRDNQGDHERRCFLFNRALLCGKERQGKKTIAKELLTLEPGTRVGDVQADDRLFAFQFQNSEMMTIFLASTEPEVLEWVKHIRNAVLNVTEQEAERVRQLVHQPSGSTGRHASLSSLGSGDGENGRCKADDTGSDAVVGVMEGSVTSGRQQQDTPPLSARSGKRKGIRFDAALRDEFEALEEFAPFDDEGMRPLAPPPPLPPSYQ